MKGLKIIRALFFNLILVIFFGMLYFKLGDLSFLKDKLPPSLLSAPPIGQFIDPFKGFWANAEAKDLPQTSSLDVQGLDQKVEVVFDDRMVPHIFAQNEKDMFFAQGYITAKNRLWQMEFQTHAAAGRISEIIGPKALPYDQFQRRIGMLYAAEQNIKKMMEDTVINKVLTAYTAGINAYIDDLSFSDYPLEYKILDYNPEKWTPLKTALLLNYMAFDLSANGSNDVKATQLLAHYGKAVTDSILPNYFGRTSPVIPRGTRYDFKKLKRRKQPEDYAQHTVKLAKNFQKQKTHKESKQSNGSNNWAISGRKSATGHPILANDPHLSLSFPSIWYEVQLSCPGYNAYGVSLPGAPAIIIGFNQDITWGVTNAYNDVLDFYQLKFKDKSMGEYFYDGKWKKTTIRYDTIKVKGGKDVIESIKMTHHGPIVFEKEGHQSFNLDIPVRHAMRWLAHDPSNDARTFYEINKSHNYEEFVAALQYYECPAQNFCYADHKNIALWVNGKMPQRWYEQGKYILDGSDPAYEWGSWLPYDHLPHVKNPRRGYVSSANQHSVDSTRKWKYPYYLGWDYSSPDRGRRINEQLSHMRRITVEEMIKLQNDNYNLTAQDVLPTLMRRLDTTKLKGNALQAFQTLKKWRLVNAYNMKSPTIFDMWWYYIESYTWTDDIGKGEKYPDSDKTIALITDDTTSHWFDSKDTKKIEDIDAIINLAYHKAIKKLAQKYGKFGDSWKWGGVNEGKIIHLSRAIPSFNKTGLVTGGGHTQVNANSGNHGPSWKMVVSMEDEVKGYGIYPGGQSGNPGSFYYDNMVERWRKGDLDELVFLKSPKDEHRKIISRMTLNK